MRFLERHLSLVDRRQGGFILPWAILVSLLGVLIAVPVITLVGNNFRGHRIVEDTTRQYYVADASIRAVMEDLIRGADAAPIPPNTYTPPVVNLGEDVPQISVQVLESETLATVRALEYHPAADPTIIQGSNPQGGAPELVEDDNSYYKLTSAGTPPYVIWEVTSETIEFPTVSFGEVRIVAASTRSSTKVDVFIYNPDDPLHTQSGYNPIPDTTVILETAGSEQTFSVPLSAADVTYLNALPTKTVKIKIRATRTGGFRLDTDQVLFSISGVVTTDRRNVLGDPVFNVGQQMAGSTTDLAYDDASYYTVQSTNGILEAEFTSDAFVFSSVDSVSMPLVLRSSKDGVDIQVFVYNPSDPAHTNGGYSSDPDLDFIVPLHNVDKAVSLSVVPADIAYLNTLSPIQMKVKIRATFGSNFQLDLDRLVFIATSNTSPAETVRKITQQYVDPGLTNPQFASVASKEGYLLRLYNVRPGILKVSWATHTADFKTAKTELSVFRGLVVDNGVVVPPGRITDQPPSQDNQRILETSSRAGDAFVQTDYVNVDEGLYTIVFYNDSANTLITDAYAASGSEEDTWIYVAAFKDYVIDIKVGNVGLKAVVRQIPGPTEPPLFPWNTAGINWIQDMVLIQSWEPYGGALAIPPVPTPTPTSTPAPGWAILTGALGNVSGGGSLAAGSIYAFRGNGDKAFWRYHLPADIWLMLADAPANVGLGGALVYANGYLYALRGSANPDFWRYRVATDSWGTLANAPANVGAGGALAWDGDSYIYAFRGGTNAGFWRYNISTNTWATLTNAPANVASGGSLIYANGYVYAFRGGGNPDFWRYNVSTGTWAALTNAPANVAEGGALTWDGTSYIYAFQGNGQTAFWRYNISTNTWTVTTNAPATVGAGGSIIYSDSWLYAFRGGGNTDFWRYRP